MILYFNKIILIYRICVSPITSDNCNDENGLVMSIPDRFFITDNMSIEVRRNDELRV